MPQILKTIEDYVVKDRKKDTFFMVFNTVYNDIHAFNKEPEINSLDEIFTGYLNEKFTDNKARDEFLQFMKKEFPNTKLIEVFDLVDSSYLTYPYLGSIAVDCEEKDDVYNAICKKYEDSEGIVVSNNAVFWMITYDMALKFFKKRKEAWESELE
jgi:effector-binding domain-containing protein